MNTCVFGAGHIGVQLINRLSEEGQEIFVGTRSIERSMQKDMHLHEKIRKMEAVDVGYEVKIARFVLNLPAVDAVIYCVGHCPAGGFVEAAIKHPLSTLPLEQYQREIAIHQIGVLNVFQQMLPKMRDGGCFVFLSSAITRLKGNFPPFLNAHHHASVISAEDWLIEGMRHDPEVKRRNIKIHRIAPAAVDTPFHHGEGQKPPAMISVEAVVTEIIAATQSGLDVDKEILPSSP